MVFDFGGGGNGFSYMGMSGAILGSYYYTHKAEREMIMRQYLGSGRSIINFANNIANGEPQEHLGTDAFDNTASIDPNAKVLDNVDKVDKRIRNNETNQIADFGRHFRAAAKYGLYIPQGALLFVTKTKMGKSLSYGRGVTLSDVKSTQVLAKSFSRSLTRVGYGLAVINAYSIQDDYSQGKIGLFQRNCEQVSNGLTQVPVLGWAWGVGWEAGRNITESNWYIEHLRPTIWAGLDHIFKH